MLITHEEILDRFLANLSWATEIDLATAWATSNEELRALQRHAPSLAIRAVVGLWGNLAEPFALRMLADVGNCARLTHVGASTQRFSFSGVPVGPLPGSEARTSPLVDSG